jgi:hypothetical protein
VGAEQVAIRVRSTQLPPVADQSVDPMSDVQAVAVKAEVHRALRQDEVHRGDFLLAEEHPAVAMVRRVAEPADAEPRVHSCLKARELKT